MSDDGTSFWERMDQLSALVGTGLLKADVEDNQVYARYQTGWGDLGDGSGTTGVITPTEISRGPTAEEWGHPGPWTGKPGPMFSHPMGGKAGFLSQTLTEMGPGVAEAWAAAVSAGRSLVNVTIAKAEELAAHIPGTAPLEVGILRGSGSVLVLDDGAPAYDRPAEIRRLSQAAIDAAHGRV